MGHFILATFLAALLAYLLGSCNSAILFSKLIKGQDIRELGSHNAGLTNTLRCFGKGMAGLVLAGDLLKGVAAVLLARLMCSLMGAGLPFPSGLTPPISATLPASSPFWGMCAPCITASGAARAFW